MPHVLVTGENKEDTDGIEEDDKKPDVVKKLSPISYLAQAKSRSLQDNLNDFADILCKFKQEQMRRELKNTQQLNKANHPKCVPQTVSLYHSDIPRRAVSQGRITSLSKPKPRSIKDIYQNYKEFMIVEKRSRIKMIVHENQAITAE